MSNATADSATARTNVLGGELFDLNDLAVGDVVGIWTDYQGGSYSSDSAIIDAIDPESGEIYCRDGDVRLCVFADEIINRA